MVERDGVQPLQRRLTRAGVAGAGEIGVEVKVGRGGHDPPWQIYLRRATSRSAGGTFLCRTVLARTAAGPAIKAGTSFSSSRWLVLPVAELWDARDDGEFARGAEIAEALRLDRGPHVGELQLGFVGHGDEFFALVRVGPGDDRDLAAQAELREGAGEGVFDGGEADHLAADLGEAFQTTEDVQEAVGIDAHDVAGIIPAVERAEGGVGVPR